MFYLKHISVAGSACFVSGLGPRKTGQKVEKPTTETNVNVTVKLSILTVTYPYTHI